MKERLQVSLSVAWFIPNRALSLLTVNPRLKASRCSQKSAQAIRPLTRTLSKSASLPSVTISEIIRWAPLMKWVAKFSVQCSLQGLTPWGRSIRVRNTWLSYSTTRDSRSVPRRCSTMSDRRMEVNTLLRNNNLAAHKACCKSTIRGSFKTIPWRFTTHHRVTQSAATSTLRDSRRTLT